MFSIPFQYFDANNFYFIEFLTCWMVCLVVFGIPSGGIFFGLGYFQPFRRLQRRPLLWYLPLPGLLFGFATGYFTVWGDHHCYAAGGSDHWYYLFGAPGTGLAGSYAGDWGHDEMWDFRSDIAIWNGLFWFSVTAACALIAHFGTMIKLNGSVTRIDNPAAGTGR